MSQKDNISRCQAPAGRSRRNGVCTAALRVPLSPLEVSAMRVLLTGAAGFIGFQVASRLSREGIEVCAVDNLSTPAAALARARLRELGIADTRSRSRSDRYSTLEFSPLDICDFPALERVAEDFAPSHICHLAAKTGVRDSVINPMAYAQTNVLGFSRVLDIARKCSVEHCVFASSSTVYGTNQKVPFAEADPTDSPASPYAATKKSNELMAHSYAFLYGIPFTGLRFFSVYGPWGRPDTVLFSFTEAILAQKPIRIAAQGEVQRDFTYIDDIVDGICRTLYAPPKGTAATVGEVPYRVYNIGRGEPIRLVDFVDLLERDLGVAAVREYVDLEAGDIPVSWADTTALRAHVSHVPNTSLRDGVRAFVEWYKEIYPRCI